METFFILSAYVAFMLSMEEMAGIAEVMVVMSEEEIVEIAHELAFIRNEMGPGADDIRRLIHHALKKHWLEVVQHDALCSRIRGSKFYIAGPASFGIVPSEMSEILEIIEFEGGRSFDWDIVACKVSSNLTGEIKHLEELANNAADGLISLAEAEKHYSELLNLFYDYDFWLPAGLPGIGAGLENISMKLSILKEQ